MTKEEALYEFLRELRIVINNASAYSKDHPYFIKSVERFQQKISTLFDFLNPVKINIAPESLFIEEVSYDKSPLYLDLAQMFHMRKLKSIEFSKGVSFPELLDFLNRISLPKREILRQGGIQNILEINKQKNPHIHIEELDYSQFLKDEGEEFKDIWVYLFKDAVRKEAPAQINEFADNFEKIIGKFKARDLLEDEELRENLYNFLAYLKDKEKEKFYRCTKELLKFILKDKNLPREDELDKIKAFFQHLNKEDFADVLCHEILREDSFNYLSFKLFSRLIGEDAHQEVAFALKEKIKNTESLENDPKLRKRVRELFSGADSLFVPEFYRHALSSLFTGTPAAENFFFDREALQINYFFLLLNLFAREDDKERLSLISGRILAEANRLIQKRRLEYLKFLWDVLTQKRKESPSLLEVFKDLDICIYDFIEKAGFLDKPPAGLEYFIDKIEKSVLGFNYYLENLFDEGKVTPFALRLLLKFFPEKLPQIYEELEKKQSDIDFLGKITGALKSVDSFLSESLLKHIFSFSNNVIKLEVLKAMRGLSRHDNEFLFSVLETEDIFLKKAALEALDKDEAARKTALEKLLSIPSPFGRKNKLLIENITLIDGMGLKEAEEYLAPLARRRFFWNRSIRKKALQTLGKWHAGKD